MPPLKIAFLHMAPVTGDVARNRRLVEHGVKTAAERGANWVITPELCIPGYLFYDHIGADWIQPQPDPWMQTFCQLARERSLTAFLSHPEREPDTGRLYNAVFVIGPDGQIKGRHRKVKALGGAERWSTPGAEIEPVDCDGVPVGILICADAYRNEVAQQHKDKGAELLVSPVAWGPGRCGPDGEWEQRTLDTGLPIMVCNRSGIEPDELDYRQAESVVAKDGRRLLAATSARSVALLFDWDMNRMTTRSQEFERVELED